MITSGNERGLFLNGVLLGGALGAMGALLLAPKSGKRLRRDIARRGRHLQHRGEEIKDRAEDAVVDLLEHGSDAVETVKDTASRARARVKNGVRSASW